MPSIVPINPKVYLAGQELVDVDLQWLSEIRIETEMRLPARLVLRFQDPDGKIAKSNKWAFGKQVVVKLPDKSGSFVVVADAEITSVGYETTAGYERKDRFDGRRGSLDEFFVVAHDKAYQLTRNCTVKGLQQVSASDMVTSLGQEAGLSVTATAGSGSIIKIASQVHSDYEMLNALADREGVDWWTEPSNKLNFGKAGTSVAATLTVGEDCTSFSVKGSALAPKTVSVRGYLPDQKQDLVKTASTSDSALWPKDVELLNGLSRGPLTGTATLVSARALPTTASESESLASGIRDRVAAASTQARGECWGNPKVVIGAPVTIKGTGPADGTYNVTKVEHVVRRGDFITRFWAGDRTPTSIVDTLSSKPAASLPATHFGLVVGVVTNIGSGEDIGKLRVKFPGLDADLVSAWGRFVAPSAGGSGRGLVMLPEIGDEVLVGFEEGDMHRPVIIGGLYAGDDKKSAWPVEGSSVTDRRYTSLNGHVVMLQDGKGDPNNMYQVTIKGEKGSVVLRMGADKASVTTPDDVPLELTCGGQSSIKFDGKGNIAIKGLKVTVEAQMGIELKSDTTLDVKAGTGLSLQSQTQAELKGAMVNVTAQGPLAAKGAIVQIN